MTKLKTLWVATLMAVSSQSLVGTDVRTPSADHIDETLKAAIAKAGYLVRQTGNNLQAVNARQQYRSQFSEEGMRLEVSSAIPSERGKRYGLNFRLASIGYGEDQLIVPRGETSSTGDRVEIVRSMPAITEWFINRASGLEHGFTLPRRVASSKDGRALRLVLETSGDLIPDSEPNGQRLQLRNGKGQSVLSYEKLKVWDARSRPLSAQMKVKGRQVILDVDDAQAEYPLTIDPTFRQVAYLKHSHSDEGDEFGWAVAISGNTAVVGAWGDDSDGDPSNDNLQDSGAVFVFVHTNSTWVQQAYLKASNADVGDHFGYSVAIDGDTLVATALREDSAATIVNGDQADNTAPNAGAAYVFVRTGTNWTQEAYLKPAHIEAGDFVGFDAAISGDTVVIGSLVEDSAATTVNGDATDNSATDSGAAYVFVRQAGVWTQQAYLKASNSGADDRFGRAVGVFGDIIAVGAFQEDSASRGVNGNQSDDSSANSGAVYVFRRHGLNWTQEAYLKSGNSDSGDNFGSTLAISGSTIVVGADVEDSASFEQNDNSLGASGAAYVFTTDGSNWIQRRTTLERVTILVNGSESTVTRSWSVLCSRIALLLESTVMARTTTHWIQERHICSNAVVVTGFRRRISKLLTREPMIYLGVAISQSPPDIFCSGRIRKIPTRAD